MHGLTDHAVQGTWPYMSAHLLKYAKKPNELADDLESFVYVFTEHVLRFHFHDLSTLGPNSPVLEPKILAEEPRKLELSQIPYLEFINFT